MKRRIIYGRETLQAERNFGRRKKDGDGKKKEEEAKKKKQNNSKKKLPKQTCSVQAAIPARNEF